jgi:hypothetical protein
MDTYSELFGDEMSDLKHNAKVRAPPFSHFKEEGIV